MKLNINAVCDVGLLRQQNQDMILVGDEYFRDTRSDYLIQISQDSVPFIVAVSDGMGGHNAGEVASEVVLHNTSRHIMQLPKGFTFEKLKENISLLYMNIHNLLLSEGRKDSAMRGMGATLVAILLYDLRFYLINIGDSRCYRLRNGILRLLSKDHSFAEISGGSRKDSHLLINSVGGGDSVFVDFIDITHQISNGDYLILCSDGLTDMLPDEVIESVLDQNINIENLLIEAKRAGGKDNISVVIMRVEED